MWASRPKAPAEALTGYPGAWVAGWCLWARVR
jgi:hypothetical protein